MQNFFTWKYWFTVSPEKLTILGFYVLGGIIIIFLLLGIITFIAKKRPSLYKGIYKNLYGFSITNFFIGSLFLFFNYENIPFFSARFWLGLWLLSFLIWLYLILKKLKKIPEKKRLYELEREKNKYLP